MDPKKIQSIKNFPIPKNLTELRSFLGLVNQLGSFTHEISALTSPFRELLKTKNKFQWLPEHQLAFEKAKDHLCSPAVLANFDPNKMTELHTDASRTNGLGFALVQKHGD